MTTPFLSAGAARMPALGFGTWPLAGNDCATAVAHALNVGYRHIDTAAMYGNEAAVGEGLRASGVARDDVWITTKVWRDSLGDGPLQRSAEASLKRLGLEAVDLLLVHWPDPATPIAETMRALAAVKRAGMARHIGVSNFVPSLIREAVANCPEPLVCNQVEFHPWLAQEKLYAATRQAGMILTAYCPLGRGRLVSDPAIAAIAKETKRTPAQVVLRWLLQIDGVAVIPKSAQKARIEENFAVFDFALSADQVARIGALGGTGGRVVNAAWAPDWAAEA